MRLGPVIPVLAFDSVEQGEHVSRALHAGGVKVLEITLAHGSGPRSDRACEPSGGRHRRRRRHDHEARALRAGEEGGRAVRRFAGTDAGHAQGRAGRGAAAAAGRDDADRTSSRRSNSATRSSSSSRRSRPAACRCCRRSTARSRTLKFCPTGGITAETGADISWRCRTWCASADRG